MPGIEPNRKRSTVASVTVPAREAFQVTLPLIRELSDPEKGWESQFMQSFNENAINFISQIQSAALDAPTLTDHMSKDAMLRASKITAGCSGHAVRTGCPDQLVFQGKVHGLGDGSAGCLLLLSAIITKENLTESEELALLRFRQRVPTFQRVKVPRITKTRSTLPQVVEKHLQDAWKRSKRRQAALASTAPGVDSRPERYMRVILMQRDSSMEHQSFQRLYKDVNERMELGDSLWPRSGSLLVPHNPAWEAFGWCTSDIRRLDYCTGPHFDDISRDVYLTNLRLQAEEADGEVDIPYPIPQPVVN